MADDRCPIAHDEPHLLIRRPQTCVTFHRGAFVSIRRAMLDRADLGRFQEAVEATARDHEDGLVLLAAFRLDPRFPIRADFDPDVEGLADTLRALDRRFIAVASVLEFGGVRAAAMRVASRAVWAVVRPSPTMADFERVGEAAHWLAAQATAAGAPADPASYVRAYRATSRHLAELDRSALPA